jgi:alpha-maltose-1-phosphate synthase
MKILMVSSFFESHNGGLEIVAGRLFNALAEKGCEIVWMAGDITPPPKTPRRSAAVALPISNFVEDKIGLPFPVPGLRAIRTIIRQTSSADVVLLHDCLYIGNIVAFLIAQWRRIPSLIIQHTRYFPNDTALVNAVIQTSTALVTKPMLSRAEQVVFVGETTNAFFDNVQFRNPPKVIFNGIDTTIFHKRESSETVPALRRGYDLPEQGTVVLFVGRFVEKKGLSVMKRMVAMRPKWIWAFAGWGPLSPERWNYPNVRVFSGLHGASLAALYRCCSLLVLPSVGEGGFPLVVREALASGLPVVCGEETLAADPAMGEFVTGAPVTLEEPDRAAREFLLAIEKSLARESRLSEEMDSLTSLQTLQDSWEQVAERYLEVISRIAPPTKSRAADVSPGLKNRCS